MDAEPLSLPHCSAAVAGFVGVQLSYFIFTNLEIALTCWSPCFTMTLKK